METLGIGTRTAFPVSLPFISWQALGHGTCSACACQHHVEGGGAAPTVALVVVVDQGSGRW